jgi:hypothetical protein
MIVLEILGAFLLITFAKRWLTLRLCKLIE